MSFGEMIWGVIYNNFAIGGFGINKFPRLEKKFACECKQQNVKI